MKGLSSEGYFDTGCLLTLRALPASVPDLRWVEQWRYHTVSVNQQEKVATSGLLLRTIIIVGMLGTLI